jgi:thiamine transport system substrate-binding protein
VVKLLKAILLLSLISANHAHAKPLPSLVVYTYDSFVSKYGPGPKLKESFEKICKCTIKYITAGDAGALLGRLRLEGQKTKAEVVLGLDSTMTKEALDFNLFAPHKIDLTGVKLPAVIEDSDTFLPLDYGWYSFMFDTKSKHAGAKDIAKIIAGEVTLDEFLKIPSLSQALILQDPRTSSVGLGLLLWVHAQYGNNASNILKQLKKNALTVGQGWSDTYGKFTQGEAPLVFSYTTSEGYHRSVEKSDRYRAIIFKNGHYLQVEVASILKSAKNPVLAKQFLNFLLTPHAQGLIASENWMYPVITNAEGLPQSYSELPPVKSSLYLSSSDVSRSKRAWINEWVEIFGKN